MKTLVFAVLLALASLAPAQTPNTLTDLKVERITSTSGACAAMAQFFPVACTTLKVSATAADRAVIGVLFVMIYTDAVGTPHVVQQAAFVGEGGGLYSTSFPDYASSYHIAAVPLSGGTPVWVTP